MRKSNLLGEKRAGGEITGSIRVEKEKKKREQEFWCSGAVPCQGGEGVTESAARG